MEVEACASAFADAVGTHRVGELVEDFAFLDETVDEHFGVLVVNIVVTCAVYDEEVALETIHEVDWTATEVAIRIALSRIYWQKPLRSPADNYPPRLTHPVHR